MSSSELVLGFAIVRNELTILSVLFSPSSLDGRKETTRQEHDVAPDHAKCHTMMTLKRLQELGAWASTMIIQKALVLHSVLVLKPVAEL